MSTQEKLHQIHLHLLAASLITEEMEEVSQDQKVKELSHDLVYQIERTIFGGLFSFEKQNVAKLEAVDEYEVLSLIHGPAY
jgi:predicted metallopeptidase